MAPRKGQKECTCITVIRYIRKLPNWQKAIIVLGLWLFFQILFDNILYIPYPHSLEKNYTLNVSYYSFNDKIPLDKEGMPDSFKNYDLYFVGVRCISEDLAVSDRYTVWGSYGCPTYPTIYKPYIAISIAYPETEDEKNETLYLIPALLGSENTYSGNQFYTTYSYSSNMTVISPPDKAFYIDTFELSPTTKQGMYKLTLHFDWVSRFGIPRITSIWDFIVILFKIILSSSGIPTWF